MDIATGLSSVSTAIGVLRELRQIDKEFDAAGIKLKVAELSELLADAKIALADAKQREIELTQEIDRLREVLSFKETLVEKNGYKFRSKEDGSPRGRPFCPRCEAKENVFIQIVPLARNHSHCPNCKALYENVPNFR